MDRHAPFAQPTLGGRAERRAKLSAGVLRGIFLAAQRGHALESFPLQAQAHPFGQAGDHPFPVRASAGPGDAARVSVGQRLGQFVLARGRPRRRARGSSHQLESTSPSAAPLGLKKIVVVAGVWSFDVPARAVDPNARFGDGEQLALDHRISRRTRHREGLPPGRPCVLDGDGERLRFFVAGDPWRDGPPDPVFGRLFDAPEQRDRAAGEPREQPGVAWRVAPMASTRKLSALGAGTSIGSPDQCRPSQCRTSALHDFGGSFADRRHQRPGFAAGFFQQAIIGGRSRPKRCWPWRAAVRASPSLGHGGGRLKALPGLAHEQDLGRWRSRPWHHAGKHAETLRGHLTGERARVELERSRAAPGQASKRLLLPAARAARRSGRAPSRRRRSPRPRSRRRPAPRVPREWRRSSSRCRQAPKRRFGAPLRRARAPRRRAAGGAEQSTTARARAPRRGASGASRRSARPGGVSARSRQLAQFAEIGQALSAAARPGRSSRSSRWRPHP